MDAGEVGAGHQVTALYEVIPIGGTVPGADADGGTSGLLVDGTGYDGAVEVSAEDMVLVKVRYKDVAATEADPAYEVASSLGASEAQDSLELAGADTRWAVAVAAFAELLKGSPFARPSMTGKIQSVLTASTVDDAERAAFVGYVNTAVGLMSAE